MAEPLNHTDIQQKLEKLNGWEFSDDKIHKAFKFEDFSEALGFIVRVGIEAEKQVHHPEITNVYNTVNISLSTHDAGDKVTAKDIELAGAIEALI